MKNEYSTSTKSLELGNTIVSPTAILEESDQNKRVSSDSSGTITGIVLAIVAVLLIISIAGVATTVLVVRRRSKKYGVKKEENFRLQGVTNPVYEGKKFFAILYLVTHLLI